MILFPILILIFDTPSCRPRSQSLGMRLWAGGWRGRVKAGAEGFAPRPRRIFSPVWKPEGKNKVQVCLHFPRHPGVKEWLLGTQKHRTKEHFRLKKTFKTSLFPLSWQTAWSSLAALVLLYSPSTAQEPRPAPSPSVPCRCPSSGSGSCPRCQL